jgi:prophage pi3 protein 45
MRIGNVLASKYHNRKTKGFDSAKEAKRGSVLELLLRAGEIENLQRQVKIELQSGFEIKKQKIRAINYIADFVYKKNGKTIIEDVKGFRTKEYLLKRKLLLKLISEKKIDAEFLES